MKNIGILLIAFFLYSCGSVPVTGRKQMLLVSNQEVLTLSLKQYGDFIGSAPLSKDKAKTEMVARVGKKISTAVETYLRNNGFADEVKNYSWEFNLVDSKDVNAFCMPGGKIVIYTGILPVTQDETGLAVVMGHEVAHAVAKHANERMSQQVVSQYGEATLGAVLSSQSASTQALASAVYGLGAQYGVMLPYNRKQELEADELGLIFMAMAGYDPSKAEAFWLRMSKLGGDKPSEFMSTHPSDNTRVNEIRKHLPKALKYYTGTTSGNAKTSPEWSF